MLALQFQIDGRAVAGSADVRRASASPAPRRFAGTRSTRRGSCVIMTSEARLKSKAGGPCGAG